MNNETIILKLKELELKHRIEILFAIESGSRAWGFSSDDSDYDVRFVYRQSRDAYLKILPAEEVLDFPEENLIDLHGWDLRKALFLLHKSNPSLIEWLHSPIVYCKNGRYEEMKVLALDYFDPKTLIMHYLSMAQAAINNEEPQVSIKKYLYYLRAVLAAKFIFERKSIPPVRFEELWCVIEETEILRKVETLTHLKIESFESDLIQRDFELEAYCENIIVSIKDSMNGFEKMIRGYEPLDAFFQEVVCDE